MKQKTMIKLCTIVLLIVTFLTIFSTKVSAISQAGESVNGLSDALTKVPYTIEDLIFNRIPAFDINIFSDKAGGKTVEQGSVIYIIRNTVKIWYYSVRNIALVFAVFMIVYLGVKIALTSVAEQKAKFKQTIFGCLKAIILIMTIHYLIIFIISLNDILIGMFSNIYGTENSIYLTIKTRAYDARFSVGIPAAIMYLALVIFFIRFIFIYFKRFYTILILIVTAPLIVVKYCLDTINGKGDAIINNWINDIINATFIQSIHALIYTVLMGIAMQLATTNIVGFILALIFINFILKSGDIIEGMFSFRGGKGNFIGDIKKPFDPKKDIALFYEAKSIYKFGTGISKGAFNLVANPIKKGVSNHMDGREDLGKSTIRTLKNNGLDSIDRHIMEKLENMKTMHQSEIEEMLRTGEYKGHKLTNDEIALYQDKLSRFTGRQNAINEALTFRINSRRSGKQGDYARKVIKKQRALKKERFTSSVKFIKDATAGGMEVALGIPLMTSDFGIGLTTLTSGIDKMRTVTAKKEKYTGKEVLAQIATSGVYGMYQNRKEKDKKYLNSGDSSDDKTKLKNTIKYINAANSKLDKIELEVNKLKTDEPDKANRYLEKLLKINGQKINNYEITSDIDEYMYSNSSNELEKLQTYGMIKKIVESRNKDLKFDEKTKRAVIADAQSKVSGLKDKKSKSSDDYDKDTFINDVASAIGDSILRGQTDDEKLINLAKATNEVKDINSKSDEDTNNKVADVESFLKRMNKN